MTLEELKALQQEITNLRSNILNLETHAKNKLAQAEALKPKLAELEARLPKPGRDLSE